MYAVASLIVERVSSTKFQTFVKNNLLTPLGMNSTVLEYNSPTFNNSVSTGWASVARNVSDGEGWSKTRWEAVSFYFDGLGDALVGPGGVVSSATDMVRIVRGLPRYI